jgi:hypothetical protein
METHSRPSAASEGLVEHLEHRLFKKPLWAYLRDVHPLVILTSPIIYLCAIPFFCAGSGGHDLPGDLLSGLWNRQGSAPRLPGV